MNILNRIKCSIVGHDVTDSESIVKTFNSNNWLRRCKRCGRYVMHSEHVAVCISEREALEIKQEFEELFHTLGLAEAKTTEEEPCE